MVTPQRPPAVAGRRLGGSSASVWVALVLILVELALGTFSSDIARWAFGLPVLGGHLRVIQWEFLMLPFAPLALFAALVARTRARAAAAVTSALLAGLVTIGLYELTLFLFTHHHFPGADVLTGLGYLKEMVVAALATFAWSIARRNGRWWLVGPVLAAAATALTLWSAGRGTSAGRASPRRTR